jgi:hypothetical protein
MEVLTLGGKQFVKASKAAKDLGYASDYVGQLCRSGAVEAHLVGRTWYVNVDTLGAHRVDKKRNARVKAREYAKKSIEEARQLSVHESTNKPQNIVIHYEEDRKELIPEVKHMRIASPEKVVPTVVGSSNEESAGYEIQNANKKVIMSGKIQVVDAEEESVLTDVTILTPKLIRRKPEMRTAAPMRQDSHEVKIIETAKTESLDGDTLEHATDGNKPMSFQDRLEALSSEAEGIPERTPTEQSQELVEVHVKNTSSILPYILRVVLFTLTVSTLALIFVENTYQYENTVLKQSYQFSIPDIEKLYKI